jgi:hypothetical protein
MRFLLFILMVLVVVTSVSAGLLMLFSFDYTSSGSGLNTAIFGATTLSNYFVLILILTLAIGGDGLIAIFLLLMQNSASYMLALIAGVSIVVWIVTVLLFIPGYHWLQGFYLVVGILISLTSYRLMGKAAL